MNFNLRLKIGTILSLVFLLLLGLRLPPKVQATTGSVAYDVIVSVAIGEPKLTLFGYTSPNALVELRGKQVVENAIADEATGYFLFERIFLPPPNPEYPELCLTAIDTHSRVSFPTCLPPLPTGPYDITVGPVLLPPTVSLEKGNFSPGEQIAAQGETIPNTKVTIYLYSADWSSGKFSLVSPALAYSIPQYQIQADKNGHFEFNLPANRPNHWRVFATTFYLDAPTPKSNTLVFKIMSFWEWLWEQLSSFALGLFSRLTPYFWQIVILFEVTIIFFLFWQFWGRKKLPKAHPHVQG